MMSLPSTSIATDSILPYFSSSMSSHDLGSIIPLLEFPKAIILRTRGIFNPPAFFTTFVLQQQNIYL